MTNRDSTGRFEKGHIPWLKGTKKLVKANSGSFKNGHPAPKTAFKKGSIPWNKGKEGVMPEVWNKGKKYPQIAKARCGKDNPMYGRTHTKEARRRIGEASNGNKHALGNRWTKETREKAMRGMQKRWLSKKPTSIEKKVYEELKRRGLLFERQKLVEGRFMVDAYIPSLNLVIEADGNYWHSLPKQIKRDRARNAYLAKCGYGLLRLTETEINNGDFIQKMEEFKI